MKILIVNDSYSRSSAAGAAVQGAEALAARGAEVHFLATVQNREEARRFEAGGVHVDLAYVPPYAIRWRAYRSINHPPAVRVFEKVAANLRPQIIHFHNLHIHFSYAALRAAKRTGSPVVFTVHDVMPFCYQKMFCFLDEGLTREHPPSYRATFTRCLACTRFRFNPLRNRLIRNRITRFVDRVVAVSTPMRAALIENRIPVHEVIPNGIDCASWTPPEDGGLADKRKLGLEECKVIFHGGRLDPLKGGLHLVRAAGALRSRIPGLKLLVPGEGRLFQKEMADLAERLDVKDALVLPGWLEGDDLKAAYGAADVVASPSLCFESFNLINLEGMAMGKPVLSSFFGGPAEVVVDGVTGYLVNPLNEKELSDKLGALLLDGELRKRMGRAGRKRAEEAYSIENTGEKIIALYKNLEIRGMNSHE
jgi:glycosyltransferase involved in cell wall biosynthesis